MTISRLAAHLGSKGAVTCVGTRKVTRGQAKIQLMLGACLALAGYKIRSGHADGSDLNFEVGARQALAGLRKVFGGDGVVDGNVLEVYLPWRGFCGAEPASAVNGFFTLSNPKAAELASDYHPAYARLDGAAKKLMERNSHQVLGPDLTVPAKFLFALTGDGATRLSEVTGKTGGTGQAIRIASSRGVPIYNLGRPDHMLMAQQWIETFAAKIRSMLGVCPIEQVEAFLRAHAGHRQQRGDVIRAALDGEVNTIIHGANIHNTMGAGFAKQLAEVFPEAYAVDCQTRKGDRGKLGGFSVATAVRAGREIRIFNAYTQARYGRDEGEIYVDYDAVRKSLTAINKELPAESVVGYPKIGGGLANGDWVTLSRTIGNALMGRAHSLFVTDEVYEPRLGAAPEQSPLGF